MAIGFGINKRQTRNPAKLSSRSVCALGYSALRAYLRMHSAFFRKRRMHSAQLSWALGSFIMIKGSELLIGVVASKRPQRPLIC